MSTKKEEKQPEETRVQPLLLTIPQVMECLALGRSKVYELIQKEGLPVKRFGRAVRIPYAALEQWLEQHDRIA